MLNICFCYEVQVVALLALLIFYISVSLLKLYYCYLTLFVTSHAFFYIIEAFC